MRPQRLAHLSDLHLGTKGSARAAESLAAALRAHEIDHAVLTGDVTHRGRESEAAAFFSIFAELIGDGRLTVVPGNHDRLGDNVGGRLMRAAGARLIRHGASSWETPRVQVTQTPGLSLVQIDSTGPHNTSIFTPQGELLRADHDAIIEAVSALPAHHLRVVMLHHHLVPLPEDSFGEMLIGLIGLSRNEEISTGHALLEALRGRCDLVLHGHRHIPRHLRCFAEDPRPLDIYNAGSSTALGRFRVFAHHGGRLLSPPTWVGTARPEIVQNPACA